MTCQQESGHGLKECWNFSSLLALFYFLSVSYRGDEKCSGPLFPEVRSASCENYVILLCIIPSLSAVGADWKQLL